MTIWITMVLFRLSVWGLIMIALCSTPFILSKCWCCPIASIYVETHAPCFFQYLTSESFMEDLITVMFIILSIKTFRCSYFLVLSQAIIGAAIYLLDESSFFPSTCLINKEISQRSTLYSVIKVKNIVTMQILNWTPRERFRISL